MPNDAKLGLLVGVVGVVFAAVMSAKPLPQAPTAANVPAPTPTAPVEVVTPAVPLAAPKPVDRPVVNLIAEAKPTPDPLITPAILPTELPSTPVVRTKREPDATPTSRPRTDGDLEP